VCHEFRCQDPSQIDAGGGGGGELGDPCTARSDCAGGFACTAGTCSQCTADAECAPSTCNLDTGRCSAEGQCTTDDECPMDEICDGGMCIFSGSSDPGGGPCGLDAVFFAFDSDKLTPKSQQELEGLASCIGEQGRQVFLEAHADNVGTEEYNILLTERRGASVKSALVGAGAPEDLLQVIAKGNLEASGTTESERAKDRRVQFIWP
jgi:peptidoglycan-associated lipoprotein